MLDRVLGDPFVERHSSGQFTANSYHWHKEPTFTSGKIDLFLGYLLAI